MNTISTDFSFFVEHDHNPLVLFSSKGDVVYLNKSAEMIMGMDTKEKLFEIAVSHAPHSFGHRVALMELTFASQSFYGINVLYSNDEEIGIQLYSRPRPKIDKQEHIEGYTSTDLNLLLQANIELFRMKFKGKLSLVTDYTMPHIHLHQNSISLLLRRIFSVFDKSKKLEIVVTIKIGSKIIINQKSYPIVTIKLISTDRDTKHDKSIRELAISNDIDIVFEEKSMVLEIPAVS